MLPITIVPAFLNKILSMSKAGIGWKHYFSNKICWCIIHCGQQQAQRLSFLNRCNLATEVGKTKFLGEDETLPLGWENLIFLVERQVHILRIFNWWNSNNGMKKFKFLGVRERSKDAHGLRFLSQWYPCL